MLKGSSDPSATLALVLTIVITNQLMDLTRLWLPGVLRQPLREVLQINNGLCKAIYSKSKQYAGVQVNINLPV